ncbi:MAG: HlyD family type I secretion periplasmic adaptor subunit, partial [Pseudomonadota bacterium]|nr:HlyD family type I secretion periplasmic adaptor subunit [Pseudomonadota bacterium]MDP2351992.1 HlyD family type I secretion periplasmic adaptor subunit [Pseudomonadota bacterium]
KRHEAAFLPAALSLQETPVHPAPRIAMGLILLFAVIALAWAVFGRIDIVAGAQGKLIPDSRSKVVQPLETASVAAIHVREGQAVQAGDLLIELDATQTTADSTRVGEELAATRLEAERARALLVAVEQGGAPRLAHREDLPVSGAGTSGRNPLMKILPFGTQPPFCKGGSLCAERGVAEQRLLEGEYAAYTTRLAQLDAEIERRQAELQSTEESLSKLTQTLPMIQARAVDYDKLRQENFVSRHGWLEKEQARIEAERDLAAQSAKREEIRASLREGQRQRAALVAETRRATLDRLREAEQQSAALEQEQIKANSRGNRMRLSAPVAGTVQQLAVHTVGGVVTPAQPLLVIVPGDNPLEVEAFVENKDIGFVRAGQAAEVKVETFNFTKYGTLRGTVTQVSGDAIQDEKRGLVYAARVKLERATLEVDGKTVNLSPGMAVTVEIKTGKRRVIEYFLSPLIQYGAESLRER